MTPRKLTASEVTFTIECEPEDLPIKGNAMASGDNEFDAKVEREIREALEGGNAWAWCSVKVTASWNQCLGYAYLGCCSYDSQKDFETEGGYYEDMKQEALNDLNDRIDARFRVIEPLLED